MPGYSAPDTFTFLTSPTGLRAGPTRYLLDTNVVSVLRTVTMKGFDLDKADHRRAADLLRRAIHDGAGLSVDLAALESAGLRDGRFSPREAARCLILPLALPRLGAEGLESFIRTQDRMASVGTDLTELDDALGGLLTGYEGAALTTVGISYTLVGRIWAAVQAGVDWERGVEELFAAMEALNYVPPRMVALTGITFAGQPDLRQRMSSRFLKVSTPTSEQQLFSAVMDLTFLMVAKYVEVTGVRCTLVTNDAGLAEFAALLDGTLGGDHVGEDRFDRRRWARWNELLGDFERRRSAASPELPAADVIEREIALTADRLGVSPPRLTNLAIQGENLGARRPDLVRWVRDEAFAEADPTTRLLDLVGRVPAGSLADVLTAAADVYAALVAALGAEPDTQQEIIGSVEQTLFARWPDLLGGSQDLAGGPFSDPIAYLRAAAQGRQWVRVAQHHSLLDSGDKAIGSLAACLLVLRSVALLMSDRSGRPLAEVLSVLRERVGPASDGGAHGIPSDL